MEEAIIYDFDNIVMPKTEFMAKFDPRTGSILSVGPSVAFENDEHKLPIDEEIALMIIEGKMALTSCSINIDEGRVEISEVKSLFKIDDVLHRIIDRSFAKDTEVDLLVSYSKKQRIFKFALSEDLGGTYKNKSRKKLRKTVWNGETNMQFYVTDYNDPNVLYQKIELSLADIKGKEVVINQDVELPADFSIYTRRLFKNYILEYENN